MPEATWRDATPQPVQDDLDALVLAAYDAAEPLLLRQREFAPFAVALSGSGGPALLPSAEGAEPRVALDDLVAAVRGQRERYRAVGFAAFVFTRGGDAVRLEVEHRDGGPALALLRPCRVGRLRRRVWTGPVGGLEGERRVWDAPVG